MWDDLSDERMGLSFTIAAGPRQRSNSWFKFRETHDHILLSRTRESSNLKGQVLLFIPQEQGGPIVP
jgi:hypothetical protein